MKTLVAVLLLVLCGCGKEKAYFQCGCDASDERRVHLLENRGWQVASSNDKTIFFRRDHDATATEISQDTEIQKQKFQEQLNDLTTLHPAGTQ